MRHPARSILALALAVLLAVPIVLRPERADAVSCGPCPATTTDNLNLRARPNLSAEVLRVIPAGAEVAWDPFRGQVDGYVSVTYDGTSGWAHNDYLLLWPGAATTTAALNLRADPSLDADVLVVMPAGAEVMVLGGPDNGFLSVRYQETSGWASADYLDVSDAAVDPSPGPGDGDFDRGDAVVTTDRLNFRTNPTVDADVITVLDAGTEGSILDGPVYAGGYVWYQLGLPGYGPDGAAPGWVASAYLSPR